MSIQPTPPIQPVFPVPPAFDADTVKNAAQSTAIIQTIKNLEAELKLASTPAAQMKLNEELDECNIGLNELTADDHATLSDADMSKLNSFNNN